MVMRTLRNKVSLIIWLSAILLVALVVGLVAPDFMSGGRGLAGAAAVVNGQPIDAQLFSKILDARLEQTRQAEGGDLSDAAAARVRRDTLNALISEQLAFDNAKSVGQTMSPAEFRQELLNDPDLQDPQGHFDQAHYEQILQAQAEQGIPWQQAEKNFQRAMLLNKVQAFWNDQAVLTPREQTAAEARFNREVRAKAIVWNVTALKAGIKISPDDLATYYSLHKQDWIKPEQLELRQIQIHAGFGESTGTAKAKADAAEASLKAGASFKALAAKVNTDKDLRKSAGAIGWVASTDLRHAAVADAASRLKIGAFSNVIPTGDGYTIIKVEGRRAGFEPTFANSKSRAAEALGAERAAQQASSHAEQALADLASGKSLETVAKMDHGTIVVTGWFNRDDAKA
ncbi:MAG: peptidylprolyl isomerase, partial [bacterium]